MFTAFYFAPRYFTDSYWTKLGLEIEVPVEPPMVTGGPPFPPRQIPFEIINVRVRGKFLVVQCSLLSGTAIGTAKALGDSVLVVNAMAGGMQFDVQHWQMIGGLASSKIILTEDEEIMLILADAA